MHAGQTQAGGVARYRATLAADRTREAQRLEKELEDAGIKLETIDAVAFIDDVVLPKLAVLRKIPSVTVHPTCSSTRLGLDPAFSRLAAAVADEVVQPDEWNCCAFAGDRGLLHPELTAQATAAEAHTVQARPTTAYASVNRTCELGMTRATGQRYRHLLEILETVTRPTTLGEK